MIVAKEKEEVLSNVTNPDDVIKFGIEEGEAAICMLINMLSRLYPNPRQTLLCEYVQNAMDSHKMAGKADVPVEITLPNDFDPHYTVRDYGVSMTHEEVKTIYAKALKSMKIEDNGLIGGYGVGKLVFSPYSGVMTMTTWVNGIKTIYDCRLHKGDGEIRRKWHGPSDEPQGVEIKIPVPESDFEFFRNRAQYLYSFLPTKPIIKGVKDEINLNPESFYETEKFTLLKENIGNSEGALATIGGMVFPISLDDLGISRYAHYRNTEDDEVIRKVIENLSVVLHFNVGEIEHTPSRSSLEYNDNTIQKIRERILVDMKTFFSDKFKEFISGVKSSYDARLLYSRLVDDSTQEVLIYKYFNLSQGGIEFNGVKYTNNIKNDYIVSTEISSNIHDRSVNYSSSCYAHFDKITQHMIDKNERMENARHTSITIKEDSTFYYVEHGYSNRKRAMKVKNHLINNIDKAICVYLHDGETIQDVADRLGLPVDIFVNVDVLEMPEIQRSTYSSSGGAASDRTVLTSKILEYSKMCDYKITVDSWNEIDHDYENDSGVYTLIRYYKPVDFSDNPHWFNQLVQSIQANYDSNFKVFGIRTSEANKIGSHMVEFTDYLKQIKDDLKEKIGQCHNIVRSTSWSERMDRQVKGVLDNYTNSDIELMDNGVVNILNKLRRVLDIRKEAYNKANNYIHLYNVIANHFNEKEIKLYPRVGDEKTIQKSSKYIMDYIYRKYPLFQTRKPKESFEYMNMIQKLS